MSISLLSFDRTGGCCPQVVASTGLSVQNRGNFFDNRTTDRFQNKRESDQNCCYYHLKLLVLAPILNIISVIHSRTIYLTIVRERMPACPRKGLKWFHTFNFLM